MKLKEMTYRFKGMLVGALLLSAASLSAQTSVSGHVKDDTGMPVIGASVLEQGTTNGTITDFDGNFTLNVQPGAKLAINYMGYVEQIVDATAAPIVVTLKEDSKALEEVVVIGYGTVKKNDATGSVTAIEPDVMNKGLTTNAQDLLQGKIAGVNVTSAGGTPGAGATIRIRGGSSLSASNDPLIVIDGLAMDNSGINGVSNPLSMVNPNDIATFTVLKDASATAIYGSRASNGVIIITTKKGAAGSKPKFSYDGNVSAGILTNRLEVMNASQYRDWLNNNGFAAKTPLLGKADTDWQDEIYRTAISTDHNFNITGGTKNMPYRASVGYTLQNGILKTSRMNRVTAALNLNPSFLDKHLTFNLNAKGMYIGNQYADGGAVGAALSMDPTRPVYDDTYKEFGGFYQTPKSAEGLNDPSWPTMSNNQTTQNPVALLRQKDDRAKAGSFIGNLEADYQIHGFEDLRLHANFGADYSYGLQETDILNTSYSNNYYGWDGYSLAEKYNLQFSAYAQYYKDFNEAHHFDAMVGYEWQHFHREGNSGGFGIVPETNSVVELRGTRHNEESKEWATENYLVSFFGRINYIALNRYMLTATVRGDGSSRFAPGKQWGLFPSVALGWKIKEEGFLRDVDAVSDLKLRLGWGITGQQDIGSDYVGLILYDQSQDGAWGTLGDIDGDGKMDYIQTSRPKEYNLDLTWEKTTTYNAGIDFGFLRNRINGSLDYYYRLTTDLISTVDVPTGTNFKNQLPQNIGSLSNQGVEIALNGVAIEQRNFRWELGINATYNINKIESLNAGEGNKDYYVSTGGISAGTGNTVQRHQEGYAANTFFVYQTELIDGSLNIVDQDNSGTIDEKDLIAYHNASPEWMLGFQTKFEFYNFDLGFTLRANIGNYVYNDVQASKMSKFAAPEREGAFSNILMKTTEIYDQLKNSGNIKLDNAFLLDRFVENASFLRCDNITLGYTFNEPKIKARVYVSASNPFVISGYSGLDPEVFGGIDNNIYPRSMTLLAGVSLQF